MLDLVTVFFEHPRALLDAVKVVVRVGDAGHMFAQRLITELAGNPVVENRWDAVRELLALPSSPGLPSYLQPSLSHAHAIPRLSTLAPESRIQALGHILRTRYDAVPFMSARDLISTLPHGDPVRFVGSYAATLAVHVHRLELVWERDPRGVSADAHRRAAAEQLLAVEQHVRSRHPVALYDTDLRALLMRAYAAARAPEHVQRHWRWLLKCREPKPAIYLDARLAAARDVAELSALWIEARGAWRHIMKFNSWRIHSTHVEGVLSLHYARLGGPGTAHEALGFLPGRSKHVVRDTLWALRAREAEAGGGQRLLAPPEPFRLLRAAGMDWDGIVFMLGPFSPYNKLLTPDRALKSLQTVEGDSTPAPAQADVPTVQLRRPVAQSVSPKQRQVA